MRNSKYFSVLLVVAIVLLGAGAYFLFRGTDEPGTASQPANTDTNSSNSLSSLKLTYQINETAKKMYNIMVVPADAEGQTVQISGKACNNMSGSVVILAKNEAAQTKVLKNLNDGRQVLEPQTISTLMACENVGPEFDDQLLNEEILNIANSLESY